MSITSILIWDGLNPFWIFLIGDIYDYNSIIFIVFNFDVIKCLNNLDFIIPKDSLDGSLIGAGIHIEKDNGLFFRFEVNDQSFDGVKLTSTNNSANSVTVTDLDGTTAKVAIGKSF